MPSVTPDLETLVARLAALEARVAALEPKPIPQPASQAVPEKK